MTTPDTDMIPWGQDPPSFLRDAQHHSAVGYAYLLGSLFAPSEVDRQLFLTHAADCFIWANRDLAFHEHISGDR